MERGIGEDFGVEGCPGFDESRLWKSPISALYESVRDSNRLVFSFTTTLAENGAILWKCCINIAEDYSGTGCSTSKKGAKALAAIDILKQMGQEVPESIERSYKPTLVCTKETCEWILPREAECRVGDCESPQNIMKGEIMEVEGKGAETTYHQLSMLATSKKMMLKYKYLKLSDPCGYLIMLCTKVGCEPPTYKCECGLSFLTTAELGPWSAIANGRTKKLSKFHASTKLVSIIENYHLDS